MAASQPSTSADGSVSATPMDWQYFTAWSYVSPLSMRVKTMLVVEFNTPRKEISSAAGMASRKTEKTGEPPSTVDSK